MLRLLTVSALCLLILGSSYAKEIRENPVQKRLERYLPYSIDEIEASAGSINFNPRLVSKAPALSFLSLPQALIDCMPANDPF